MHASERYVKTEKGHCSQFVLMPFGDLQAGSPVFVREKWDEYVADVKNTPNVITIGMGDYTDNFRPTIQGRLYAALGRDDSSKTIDQMHQKQIRDDVYPLLKPVVSNSSCLGLLGGHHDLTYSDGTNSTQYLCRLLGVPYLGDGEALVRVHLRVHTVGLRFDLYATHGQGTGGAVGSNIGKLQRMLAHMDVDVMLRGHSCDKFIFQEPQYFLSESSPPRLRQRNRLIANCGSFSDGRAETETTYVEKGNLIPKAVGYIKVHIRIKREVARVDGRAIRHGWQLVLGD